MTKENEKHCEICGEQSCKDPLVHVDDEETANHCMGVSLDFPFCYCPNCGEGQTIYESDGVYDCKCGGKVRHPMAVIENAV